MTDQNKSHQNKFQQKQPNPTTPIFDPLAKHFSHKIYNSDKGRLRLDLLQQDLQPLHHAQPLQVLDAGGGLGHMSRWFAQQGHQVTLCDQSAAMLSEAGHMNTETGLGPAIQLIHSGIEDFCDAAENTYNLILCHAVLEWSEQPQLLIQHLTHCLKPGGYLSLMFFNRHSLTLRNALRGNFRKAMHANYQRDAGSLTPENPQEPDHVYQWLAELGYTIELTAGMRCFYDYLPKQVKDTYAYTDILEVEQAHRHQQPYLHMARYIHVLARRGNPL